MSASSQRYTTVAIALHWAIAVSIIGMIFGGWYMTDLPDGAPGQYFLFQLHKSLGITILLLTVTRILWRVMNPPCSQCMRSQNFGHIQPFFNTLPTE